MIDENYIWYARMGLPLYVGNDVNFLQRDIWKIKIESFSYFCFLYNLSWFLSINSNLLTWICIRAVQKYFGSSWFIYRDWLFKMGNVIWHLKIVLLTSVLYLLSGRKAVIMSDYCHKYWEDKIKIGREK